MTEVPKREYFRCNNCSRDNRQVLLSFKDKGEGEQVVKCNCGLVYQNPRLSEEDLNKYYDSIYFSESEKDFTSWRKFPDDLQKNIMDIPNFRLFKDRGTFLDVGCGIGVSVAYMKEIGWDSRGIDISEYSTEIGRKEKGLNLITGDILEYRFRPDFFDAVYMRDVIEHLSKPRETLQEVHRIMSNGGLLVITTGNVDSIISKLRGQNWFYYQVDHIHYFSIKTISSMLNDVGFEIIGLGGEYFGGRSINEVIEKSHGKKLRILDFLMTSKMGPLLYKNGFINLANLITPVMSVYAKKMGN